MLLLENGLFLNSGSSRFLLFTVCDMTAKIMKFWYHTVNGVNKDYVRSINLTDSVPNFSSGSISNFVSGSILFLNSGALN